MNQEEIVLELSKNLKPIDIPVGYYVSTIDGKVTECNDKFREILDIPVGEPLKFSFLSFYKNEDDRDRAIKKLMILEKEGKWLEKQIFSFLTRNKREIYVQDYCRTIRDKENKVVGFCGCIVDFTKEEHNKQLFDNLPAGVYRLDENDKIIEVNESVLNILGYDTPEELIGRNIKDLYSNPHEEEKIENKIKKDKKLINEKVELVKKNNETIYVSVNTFELISPEGNYSGREGIFTDRTIEEIYHKMMEDVPVGFYVLRTDLESGKDIIVYCNKQFENLFEFDENESAIGFDIKTLTYTAKYYETYIEKLEKEDTLLNYPLQVKTKKNRDIIIEVNTRILRNHKGDKIGREGVLKDITETEEVKTNLNKTKHQLEKITADLHKFIHTFRHPVIKFYGNSVNLNNIIKSIFKYNKTQTLSIEYLTSIYNNLINLCEQILNIINKDEEIRLLEKITFSRNSLYNMIKSEKNLLLLNHNISLISLSIYNFIEKYYSKSVRKELITPIKKLEEFSNIILQNYLLQTFCVLSNESIIMDKEVETLREILKFKKKKKYIFGDFDLRELLNENVARFTPIAEQNGLKLTLLTKGNLLLSLSRNDVDRMLTNLLDNAVKYSKKDSPHFIKIKAREIRESKTVELSIESYGTPIKENEIDRMFEFGERGEFAIKSSQDGTGIGLQDAKETMDAHKGTIKITSIPSIKEKETNPPSYKLPYITTVEITFSKNK